MANPAEIFQTLNNQLFTKYFTNNAEIEIDGDKISEDQASKRFLGHYLRRGRGEYKTGHGDEVLDVDTINAGDIDDDYVTNKPINLPEQIRSILDQGVPPEQFGAQAAGGNPEMQGTSPADVGAQAAGGDPGGGAIDTPEEMGAQAAQPYEAGGIPDSTLQPGLGQPLPEEDVSKSPSDLGRVYELKKIYTRLTVIETFLSESSDPSLIETRNIVSKAIELFEILASNMASYKPPRAPEETLDEIIITYYRFLEKVYEGVAKYYKKQAQEHNINMVHPTKPKIKINIPNV
jgi:hypothetical protein